MEPYKLNDFSVPFALCPLPTDDEEFNLCHSIDRDLYMKLIFDLRRYIMESMNVMAFWMFLDQQHSTGDTNPDYKLVKKILSKPLNDINDVADESVMCMKCMENSEFSFPEGSSNEVTLLPSLLNNDVSLKFFYERRVFILKAIRKMIEEVCCRAFKDINQDAILQRRQFNLDSVVNGIGFSFDPVDDHQENSNPLVNVKPSADESISGSEREIMDQSEKVVVNKELGLIPYGCLSLQEVEEIDVHPEDRTIVLTTPSVDPMTEAELRDFFTTTFGDFIEEIQVQSVPPGDDVHYALLVARRASMVDEVVNGGKAKFNIKGKLIYAKKSTQ